MILSPAPRRSALIWVGAFFVVLVGLALTVRGFRRKPIDHWEEVAKGRAYLDHGRPDLAFQTVSSIRDEAPGAGEAMTVAARALVMYGQISGAKKTLERALKLQPRQAEAAKMLAAIYLSSGDGPRGLALLRDAAQLEPKDYRPWFAMGKVYHDLGELADAADAYAQSLQRSPPPVEAKEARIGRVRALLDANRADEAALDLAKARDRDPGDPILLGLAAAQARASGQLAEARALADRTLTLDSRNFDALFVRAQIRHQAGEEQGALADLEQAVNVNRNHLGALQLLTQVEFRLGLTERATATKARYREASERSVLMDRLTREINAAPEDPKPRWRMGQAAVAGEMYTLAYQCFQAALDLDPKYEPARDALAALRAQGHVTSDQPRPSLLGPPRALTRHPR